MSNNYRISKTAAHLKWLTKLLGTLLLLLAIAFGWSAFTDLRKASNRASVEKAKTQLHNAVAQKLSALTTQMNAALSPETLRSKNADHVVAALRQQWPEAEIVAVWAEDLAQAYSDPQQFGYSKLQLLETASQQQSAVIGLIRNQSAIHLGVAGPISLATQGKHIAYVQLPLTALRETWETIAVPGDTYWSLSQYGYVALEKGPSDISEKFNSHSNLIDDTGFELTYRSPLPSFQPFQLGKLGNSIGLILFTGLGISIFFLPSLSKKYTQFQDSRTQDVRGTSPLTLNETIRQDRPPAYQRAATPSAASPTEAPVDEPTPQAQADISRSESPVAIKLDARIFRPHDIQGLIPSELSPQSADAIGQAIGSVMQEHGLSDIVVGRDNRESGASLTQKLIEGLLRSGRNVIDIGIAPTPEILFAAYTLRTGCAIAVTANHSSANNNGFKIMIGGESLHGAAITDLAQRIGENRLFTAETPGTARQQSMDDDYIQRIADDIQLQRPLKIVLDARNGVAEEIAPRLFDAIGAQPIALQHGSENTHPGGSNDNDAHYVQDLAKSIEQFDADLGLIIDGDGSQLNVVTRTGERVSPDHLLMLFAQDLLLRNPGAVIVYDVNSTGKLSDYILQHGGSPVMWKSGHPLIRAKMQETGADLGGEMNGHFFFGERWYGFDDGLYSAARLLELLAASEDRPENIFSTLPITVGTPEIRIAVDDAQAIVGRFLEMEQQQSDSMTGARLTTIDGFRADWPEGWGLVRASHIGSELVLRFEGDSEDVMVRIKNTFSELLSNIAPEIKLDF